MYHPVNPPEGWLRQSYTGLLVGSGFVVLLLSRVLMHLLNRRRPLHVWQYIVWSVGEVLVFIVGLTLFSYSLADGEGFFPLLLRVSLDVVSILVVPYIITMMLFMLDARDEEIARLRSTVESLTALPGNTSKTFNFHDQGGKMVFATHGDNVLYIEAADNYCNIHYVVDGKEEVFVLHNSMKYFETWGEECGLLRCHRSYIVNMRNVKLLRREKDGLTLELLRGGGVVPVSRTYRDRVIEAFTPTPLPEAAVD